MDTRVKELIDFTKEKFGLDNYYLERHHIDRNVNIFNDTIYTLCMEWFPGHVFEQADDDSNPEGTAVIEIDVNDHKFQSVIFVGGKSFANGMKFNSFNKQDVIRWIEQETQLVYGKQFKLDREDEGEFYFKACINGVTVSPFGFIEIKCDQEGKLTFFSVDGEFPIKEIIKEDIYKLSLEKVQYIVKEQLKLSEFPSFEQERLFPVYAIEEIYLTNDQMSTIPFGFIDEMRSQFEIDKTIYWEEPIKKPFEGEEIHFTEDITAEQAFSGERSPDSYPITRIEQEKCVTVVEDFLRQEYRDDTGKWILKTLHRDKGYIHAIVRLHKQESMVFQRKLTILIDANILQVENYIDNKPMLEIFNQFQATDEVSVTREQAYARFKDLIELTPVYVYNFKQKRYILCGKIDCHYGVDASTGEVIALDDL